MSRNELNHHELALIELRREHAGLTRPQSRDLRQLQHKAEQCDVYAEAVAEIVPSDVFELIEVEYNLRFEVKREREEADRRFGQPHYGHDTAECFVCQGKGHRDFNGDNVECHRCEGSGTDPAWS